MEVIFIDFKGAYDGVDRNLLMEKLRKQGISEVWLNTMSKLMNSLSINGIPSRKGTPQGGILSPVLFNRFVDDLAVELRREECHTLFYADDLAVVCLRG